MELTGTQRQIGSVEEKKAFWPTGSFAGQSTNLAENRAALPNNISHNARPFSKVRSLGAQHRKGQPLP